VLHTVIEKGGAVPAPSLAAGSLAKSYGPSNGELYFQRCRWCRTPAFRRQLCPICACSDFDRERSSGTGFIRRITGPGNVATIAMAEGFWLRSRVISEPPLTLRIGVQVQFAAGHPQQTQALVFRLCDGPPPTGHSLRGR
jgi:hypothetical protein